MATLTKENIELLLTYSFRYLVHYHYGRKHVRQTWCWKRSWQFYIQISRQQQSELVEFPHPFIRSLTWLQEVAMSGSISPVARSLS